MPPGRPMLCKKSCRFVRVFSDLYRCITHGTCHRCDHTCNTIEPQTEGSFCYLTGIQKDTVELLQHDYSHNCTRVVKPMTLAAKAKRRKCAVNKRVRLLCPPAEVAAIIKTLYCKGPSRDSAGRVSAKRAQIKLQKLMASGRVSLEVAMQVLRVGVATIPGSCDDAIISTIAVAISNFARTLSLPIKSQAAAAAFPVLFTATMCSKMHLGETVNQTKCGAKSALAWRTRVLRCAF